MDYLPCVEVEPAAPATASVIWLHGLGANGHDFEPIVPELQLPAELAVRFVFPHAPSIPVTINGGMSMPAWYDILAMDDLQAENTQRKIDERQILRSSAAVSALIDREIERGVPSRRIVLAGFSQSGAVAYHVALSYAQPLAGLMALSTYFATQRILTPHEQNRGIPIQVFHGRHDPIVPEAMGRSAVEALTAMGYAPEYKSYAMDHAVCAEQIRDISHWLQARLTR